MIEKILTLTTLLPILSLVMVTVNSRDLKLGINTGKTILSLGILGSISALIFLLLNNGLQIIIFGFETTGTLLRLDPLSTIMFLMVSIIGFVVLRFSKNYLQGDSNHISFIRRLLSTIALVQLLVLSGNLIVLFLAWVMTSFGLQYLINYYNNRKEAQRAVRKKFITARISDLSLLVGFVILYLQFGSCDLEIIFSGLKKVNLSEMPVYVTLSGIFIALSAIVKSVQIPFHGWILDVMEAPTPVSGLLHAGLLNSGPFLIIRFSTLMDASGTAGLLLLIVGGISALYGTIVFPSQPAVKTSLAYSSIGHMGFSLMICGMGFYSAALLHLIGHSFYKAHAFLSSGSAIDKKRLSLLRSKTEFKTTIWNAFISFAITLLFYLSLAQLWVGLNQLSFQMIILGGIIIAGVSSYMMKTTAFANSLSGTIKSIMTSGFIMLSFFTLENTIGKCIESQIPEVIVPDHVTKKVSLILLMLFVAAIYLPMLIKDNKNNLIAKWEVYRRNGFYVNIFFDRLINPVFTKTTK